MQAGKGSELTVLSFFSFLLTDWGQEGPTGDQKVPREVQELILGGFGVVILIDFLIFLRARGAPGTPPIDPD